MNNRDYNRTANQIHTIQFDLTDVTAATGHWPQIDGHR